MGTLFYGATFEPITVPDDVLTHVQVVIVTKLRRNESFTLSWRHPDHDAPGRSSIWLHPSIPLRFKFDRSEPGQLNLDLLRHFAEVASASGGLVSDVNDRASVAASTPELQPA